jgi:hypothetical protein
MVMKPTDI